MTYGEYALGSTASWHPSLRLILLLPTLGDRFTLLTPFSTLIPTPLILDWPLVPYFSETKPCTDHVRLPPTFLRSIRVLFLYHLRHWQAILPLFSFCPVFFTPSFTCYCVKLYSNTVDGKWSPNTRSLSPLHFSRIVLQLFLFSHFFLLKLLQNAFLFQIHTQTFIILAGRSTTGFLLATPLKLVYTSLFRKQFVQNRSSSSVTFPVSTTSTPHEVKSPLDFHTLT